MDLSVSMYMIVCKDLSITDCYIGRSQNIKSRKSSHYSCSYNTHSVSFNKAAYQFIRSNGGWNNWEIIEIEKYKPIIEDDEKKRERYWYDYYNPTLNKNIPYLTYEESVLRQKNRSRIYSHEKYNNDGEYRKKQNQYYQEKYNNDEAFREKQKQYQTEKYKNDAIYRNKKKQYSKERNRLNKLKLENENLEKMI